MSAPFVGGLPLPRTTYVLVVGAAGLLWSVLWVAAIWEGVRRVLVGEVVDHAAQ